MSGGEKQRIAFASIYAMNPDIYCLDEPSANLDEESIINLKNIIRLIKSQGKTIVIAEHRLWYIADLIDRAVLIDEGEIKAVLKQEEFSRLPADERQKYGLRSLEFFPVPNGIFSNSKADVIETGLSVRDLSAGYKSGRWVWKNLSFDFRVGKIYAVTGRNGAGKSTFAKVLTGLMKEKSGAVYWNGKLMKPRYRRKIAFLVMQDVNAQLFAASVREEVLLDADGSKESIERAKRALEELELFDWKERNPFSLSGGQRQRLAVADAISVDKPLIIFDEPTSGLDYRRMKSIVKVMRKMAKTKKTIIVITHDAEFIRESGAEVISLGNKEEISK